ncbi:MAG: hypothetical protein ACE366_12675 [Bradymonadia bacterium]
MGLRITSTTMCLALWAMVGGAGEARAQISGGEGDAIGATSNSGNAMYWAVPELIGAPTFTLELSSRLDSAALISGPLPTLPSNTVSAQLGWRQFFDPWGQFNLHVYGGLGRSGLQFVDDRDTTFVEAKGGLALQARGINEKFFFLAGGIFIEGGLLWIDGEEEPPLGTRWAVGVETGVGTLWYADPYFFVESIGRLGVESIDIGGFRSTALMATMRIGFDFAIPQGHATPLEYDPYKLPPPL